MLVHIWAGVSAAVGAALVLPSMSVDELHSKMAAVFQV